MWEWKPLMHYDNILHTCLTVAFNTSDDCSLHNAYNEQLLITACVMHRTQHIVNITDCTFNVHRHSHNWSQSFYQCILLDGAIAMRFCPAVCLSVTLLIHAWMIQHTEICFYHMTETWQNHVGSFLTSNFIAVSDRGSYQIGLDRYRYRVSSIGRYSPVLVGIGIGRYLFEYRHRYQ